MELHEFPRPPKDNGRGVHWSISAYEWGKRDWDFWAEQLLAMKIKWVKIIDDGGGSALPVARRLVDLGIMPVVRLYWPEQNPGNISQRGRETVRRYVEVGAMYFETNNEPDLDLEWKGNRKPPNWLEIVVSNFIIDADIVLEEGGYPAVPAFGVGTLRDPFQTIVELGRRDILDGGAWAALHNYCLARPLEYPNDPVNMHGVPITEQEWHAAGGAWAWEMGWEEVNRARRELANPNADIMTDATCFRAYEQLNAYIVRAVGHSIPIMTTEGGYNVAQRAGTTAGDDPRYPKPTPQAASEMNLEMFKFMQGDREVLGKKVPDYYFAVMPWLIAAQRIGVLATPAENQGPWFTHKYDDEWGLNGELPLVSMLKELPSRTRQDGPLAPQWQKPPTPDRSGRDWDYRLNYLGEGIKLEPVTGPQAATAGPRWKLVQARWLNEKEARGASQIFVKALDKDGNPLENAAFVVARPGASDPVVTKGPIDDYWGNYTMYGLLGTYTVSMTEGSHPSEKVSGVGLGTEEVPNAWANTAFRFTFQLVEGDEEVVATGRPGETGPEIPTEVTGPGVVTPTPDVTSPGEGEVRPEPQPSRPAQPEQTALHQVLRAAAQSHLSAASPRGKYYHYARKHALGNRLSGDFTFEHAGIRYTAQVFEKAIIYAPVGQWDQVTHIAYEG
ncbi:MAG: hypothetical protein Kow0063_35840 [Anaerolineae bacterium]